MTKEWGDLEVKHDQVIVEQYGMKLEIGVRTETRARWEPRYRTDDGTELTTEDVHRLREEGELDEDATATLIWVKGEEKVEGQQPIYCKLFDNECFQMGTDVYFFGTPDGPIIAAVEKHEDSEWMTLWDPAIVQYAANGQINLVPVFGVARSMDIQKEALKQRIVPGPLFAEVYLQFVMQNRQFKYELRPVKPMASTPRMDNDEEAPNLKVVK